MDITIFRMYAQDGGVYHHTSVVCWPIVPGTVKAGGWNLEIQIHLMHFMATQEIG